jgi:hypothetical protein
MILNVTVRSDISQLLFSYSLWFCVRKRARSGLASFVSVSQYVGHLGAPLIVNRCLLVFIFNCFIIHMCIQGLGHFSPLPPPPLFSF